MYLGNLPLLHQLALLEYNVLIYMAVLNYIPRDPTTIEDCDESIGINDNESDDEIEDQLTKIENEMTMLLAVGLSLQNVYQNQKKKDNNTQKCI